MPDKGTLLRVRRCAALLSVDRTGAALVECVLPNRACRLACSRLWYLLLGPGKCQPCASLGVASGSGKGEGEEGDGSGRCGVVMPAMAE